MPIDKATSPFVYTNVDDTETRRALEALGYKKVAGQESGDLIMYAAPSSPVYTAMEKQRLLQALRRCAVSSTVFI